MAWNKPTSNTVDATSSLRPTGRGKMPRLRRGLLAGVIVVLGAGIAAWFFSNGEAASSSLQKKDRGLIKEVTPAAAPKAKAQAEKDAHPGMVKVRGKWYPEYNKQGGKIWISKNWVRYHSPQVYTNRSNTANIPEACKLFDHQADRDIAELLTTPLGTTYLGDWQYNHFEKGFLESLKTPIIVTKEDDEWAAEVKRSVNNTKIELKARYDAGEDLAKIMTDTRRELQKLGVYKMELQSTMRESIREAKGDKEQIRLVYEAANKMLAERGIEPLTMPRFLTSNLKLETMKKETNE